MFWAITSYFNPARYQSRRRNYRIFRKHLAAPLVTVELSFDGRFELTPDDADILVQITGGDVLWQKERLLNLALPHLPRDCDNVAWVDCDVVFANDQWLREASAALEKAPLVQLFSEGCNLTRDARLEASGWSPIESCRPAIGAAIAAGWSMPENVRAMGATVLVGAPIPGLAWAARRSLLERHGLYDGCVIGAGDWAIVCAALGQPDHCVVSQAMTGATIEHYLAWARPFFADVGGRVDHVEGRIFHLWHGSQEDRRHRQREWDLAALGFDPLTDLALDAAGCWKWNSDKPDLHDYVRSYFASRNEDGLA
jgi:hypothetical protein